jgi:glucan 1,3-beta-glucosidase
MLFVCAAVLQFVVFSVAGEYFYGLNYGINSNQCPSLDEIKSDLTVIKQYSNRVRTFSISSCNEGQLALQAANDLGMHIYLGMWVDSADTFNTEMAALKNLLASGLSLSNVDAIIVGSEVLYRGDMGSAELVNYIKQVGDAVRPKGVKVTTADVYYMFPPEVVEQLDFLVM